MKIFIIHNWRQEYLLWCVRQLLKYNDAKDIIFLTDNKDLTKKYIWEDSITYENISDYSKSANEFAKYYQHRSYNKHQYELFCFQRWLVINDYVNEHDIKVFCHIDSDVLLFCNAEEYYKKNLSWYDFCYTWFCWHTSFMTKKGVNEFSVFLMNKYKNEFKLLEPYFTWEKICSVKRNNWYIYYDRTNCVTDMTLFDIFVKEYCKLTSLKIKDIWIINDSSVFDSCINMSEWFIYNFWLKKIMWDNNRPYSFLDWDKIKKKYYFNTLHFQWESKIFMQSYYCEESCFFKNSQQLFYRIKKWIISLAENVFKILWIYEFARDVYLRFIRNGIDPKNNT